MDWNMADWIGLAISAPVWAVVLWALWRFGEYEVTGCRGWHRIPAGVMVVYDFWCVRINHWAAQHSKGNSKPGLIKHAFVTMHEGMPWLPNERCLDCTAPRARHRDWRCELHNANPCAICHPPKERGS